MRYLRHRTEALDGIFSATARREQNDAPASEDESDYPTAPDAEYAPPAAYSSPSALQRYYAALSRHPRLTPEQLLYLARQMEESRAAFRRRLLVEAHYITYPQADTIEDRLRRKVVYYQDVLENPQRKEQEALNDFYAHLRQLKRATRKLPFPIEEKQRRYSQKSIALLQQAAVLGKELPLQPEWWKKVAEKVYASPRVEEKVKGQLQAEYNLFQQSITRIVEGNLSLVVSIAQDFQGRGEDLLDLFQDGNLGLMKAAERFDYKLGYKFSTYASWWIHHTIQRGINNTGRTIRHPVHAWGAFYKLRRGERELEQKLGRSVTEEELAAHLGFAAEKIRRLKQLEGHRVVSLSSPISDDDSRTLEQFLVDEKTPAPGEALTKEELIREAHKYLDLLSPRESYVLRERLGLQARRERTLKSVGQDLGVTRERTRQIQEEAYRKIRARLKGKALKVG